MAMSLFDSSNSKVGNSGGDMKKVVINKCWSRVTAVAKWLVVCDNCIIVTNSSLREFSLSEYLMLNTSCTARDIILLSVCPKDSSLNWLNSAEKAVIVYAEHELAW